MMKPLLVSTLEHAMAATWTILNEKADVCIANRTEMEMHDLDLWGAICKHPEFQKMLENHLKNKEIK